MVMTPFLHYWYSYATLPGISGSQSSTFASSLTSVGFAKSLKSLSVSDVPTESSPPYSVSEGFEISYKVVRPQIRY